jgi:hypothetical protein
MVCSQRFCFNKKAAIDDRRIKEYGCNPMKLDLQNCRFTKAAG